MLTDFTGADRGYIACGYTDLHRAGLLAEETMYEATAGVNTHNGAIFPLGLPAVREIGLPAYRQYRNRGMDKNRAGAITLLHLVARVEDANMLSSGGVDGADRGKKAAADLFIYIKFTIPSLVAYCTIFGKYRVVPV